MASSGNQDSPCERILRFKDCLPKEVAQWKKFFTPGYQYDQSHINKKLPFDLPNDPKVLENLVSKFLTKLKIRKIPDMCPLNIMSMFL